MKSPIRLALVHLCVTLLFLATSHGQTQDTLDDQPDADAKLPMELFMNDKDNMVFKRGWNDLGAAWGKRGDWNKLQNVWGKRSSSEENLTEDITDDDLTDELAMPVYPKREWHRLQNMWGKRNWNKLQGVWGKRTLPLTADEEWMVRSIPAAVIKADSKADIKREWSNLRGAWGKRELANLGKGHDWTRKRETGWNNLKGLWG